MANFNDKSLKNRMGQAGAFALLAATLISCSPATSVPVTTQCVSNADQASSFKGHWTSHPIPLGVVANDFTSSELATLEASIATWNNFFNTSKGFKLYLSNSSSSGVPLSTTSAGGARVTSATACSQSMINPNGFSTNIMIYKNTTNWTYGSAIMALTSLCPQVTSNSTYRMFTSAVMELNFVDYFQPGKPIPDLQTEVTHELGHVLGLDHSCNGNACTNAPADYTAAVMYPTTGFSGIYGSVNRILQTNDQQRANCLY